MRSSTLTTLSPSRAAEEEEEEEELEVRKESKVVSLPR